MIKLTLATLVQEVDNTPDMDAAVDLEDNVGGKSLLDNKNLYIYI